MCVWVEWLTLLVTMKVWKPAPALVAPLAPPSLGEQVFMFTEKETETRLSSLAQGYVLSTGSRRIMHTEKIPCDLDLWPWNSLGLWRLSIYMCVQNFIKLSAAVHELSRWQTFLLYFAVVKNPKIRSRDLIFDLWPWNSLGFERLSRYVLTQNSTKLRAAVHELSCAQRRKIRRKQ